MKRNLLAILIGALVATPAFARTGLKPNEIQQGFTFKEAQQSDTTRAEVRQDLRSGERRARLMGQTRLGLVPKSEQIGAEASHKTRAEVRAEVVKAYRNGNLIAENAEIGKYSRM